MVECKVGRLWKFERELGREEKVGKGKQGVRGRDIRMFGRVGIDGGREGEEEEGKEKRREERRS